MQFPELSESVLNLSFTPRIVEKISVQPHALIMHTALCLIKTIPLHSLVTKEFSLQRQSKISAIIHTVYNAQSSQASCTQRKTQTNEYTALLLFSKTPSSCSARRRIRSFEVCPCFIKDPIHIKTHKTAELNNHIQVSSF